jgi:uncharacterized protein
MDAPAVSAVGALLDERQKAGPGLIHGFQTGAETFDAGKFHAKQKGNRMNDERIEKILYIGTNAGENPEKAAMPFVMANAALAMDIQAVVVLQGNGVYLAQKGYAEKMTKPGGFPPVAKLLSEFLELGGRLLVCVPCIKERNIDENTDLVAGASTTAAGALNVEATEAKAVFVY